MQLKNTKNPSWAESLEKANIMTRRELLQEDDVAKHYLTMESSKKMPNSWLTSEDNMNLVRPLMP